MTYVILLSFENILVLLNICYGLMQSLDKKEKGFRLLGNVTETQVSQK